jgi:hypothetical protein
MNPPALPLIDPSAEALRKPSASRTSDTTTTSSISISIIITIIIRLMSSQQYSVNKKVLFALEACQQGQCGEPSHGASFVFWTLWR